MTLAHVRLILFDKKHVISNYYYFNLYIYIYIFFLKALEEEAGYVSKR